MGSGGGRHRVRGQGRRQEKSRGWTGLRGLGSLDGMGGEEG